MEGKNENLSGYFKEQVGALYSSRHYTIIQKACIIHTLAIAATHKCNFTNMH